MNLKLAPYAEYKDPGVPWFGDIPKHWRVLRSKYVLSEVDARSSTGMETHLSMSQKYGLIPSSQIEEHRLMSESNVGGKLCEPGDVVLNRLKAHLGVFAVAKQAGIVSPDYTVFRPRNRFSSKYYELVLRTPLCRSELRIRAKGIVEGFWRLYTDDFYDIRLPSPPFEEQEKIVSFCRVFSSRFNRLIRVKRRLIELLNEQKQVIIHLAVTRGLDPTVRLKPSGIEWLGDVPEHWKVAAVRLRYSVELGKMLDAKRITGDYLVPYLRNINVQWDRIDSADLPMMDIAPHEYERYSVKPGDLLVCEGGEVGRAAFWTGELPLCGFQKALHRLRPISNETDYSRFLFYVMYAVAKRGVFVADGSENTIAHLTGEKLRRHRFAFPPKHEQQEIVRHLDSSLEGIRNAVEHAQSQIRLIHEYRVRLISDVVTGKLDVRGVELPTTDEDVITEEFESLDEPNPDETDNLEETADDDD